VLAACKEKKTVAILAIGSEEKFEPDVYSQMAIEPASREKFTSSVMRVMEIVIKYGLGGLLINWQYPVVWWVSQIQKRILINTTVL
jgi:GH18 family chitinase